MFGSFIRALVLALAFFPPLALAQSSPIPGFPPGVFSNKAALDPAPGGGVPFSLTFSQNIPSNATSTSVPYSVTLPSGCTRIVVAISGTNFTANLPTVSSVTFPGSIAGTVVTGSNGGSNNGSDGTETEIWESNSAVAGGAGTITVVFNFAPNQFGSNSSELSTYCLKTNTPTAAAGQTAGSTGTTSLSVTINIPASGGGVCNVGSPNGGTYTWTNAASDASDNAGGMSYNVAHTTATGASTAVSTIGTPGGPGSMSCASWSD